MATLNYLNIFENIDEYDNVIGQFDEVKTNVSYCVQEHLVIYMPHSDSNQYIAKLVLKSDSGIGNYYRRIPCDGIGVLTRNKLDTLPGKANHVRFGTCATEIDDNAFKDDTILELIQGGLNVTRIGVSAFEGCTNLKSSASDYSYTLYLPAATSIGDYAFKDCYNIPFIHLSSNQVPTLGDDVFINTRIMYAYVPDDIIKDFLSDSDWESFNDNILPQSDMNRIVAYFNVTDTVNPTNILGTTLNTNITEIEIDGVVQSVVTKSYTFDTTGEHVVKYKIDSPSKILNNTFKDVTSLTKIILPYVSSIGQNAFSGCTSLESIIIRNMTPPSLSQNVFTNNANKRKIYVPYQGLNDYKNSWSDFSSVIVAKYADTGTKPKI